ncbi:C39 family peptidase [Sedimentibacter sp. B4]|uniref:C39 family peptidase n=1 Tax=Sedimentibacter sp. B4 TaxID=304766 RepID=UPI0002E6BD50|nr:C39 family peptidase [Sedimentibacter sp. B4]
MDWICENKKLSNNELTGLELEEDFLRLREGMDEGFLVTPIIETEKFSEITPSWNSRTDENSFVEVFIQVRIENQWTDFVSYGVWSTDGFNKGIKEHGNYEHIRVTEDRIFIKDNKFADAVRMKAVLTGKSPKLKLIAFSTDSGEDEELEGDCYRIIENVPTISQLASGHKDSHSICSPTSLTMTLKFHGKNLSLDEVTKGTFDTGSELYGNWPQNTAYAGEQGMRAYTKKCKSINVVKNLIAKGIPVVASVVSKNKEQLDGAISAFPSGHLMVVVGFQNVCGTEYIVVNDPAANSDEEVRKMYNLDQWVKVWRHYIYNIIPNVEK